MDVSSYVNIITDQTERALWEVGNVVECIPDSLWNNEYCHMPMWKHVYHMLHSLDLWFINPRDKEFKEPSFHVPDLNNLDISSPIKVTKEEIREYYKVVIEKTRKYLKSLQEEDLLDQPSGCEYTRFTLILAQHRHLHSHMGMIMGFLIDDTGLWPRVIGLEGDIPSEIGGGLYF